ncbi:MAG: tail fiber domain-containing protein [Acidobacteriota bacterium]
MTKIKYTLISSALLCIGLMGLANQAMGQTITADIVQADRLRSNDTGNNGQFWERTEDSQNTMRYLYGPLDPATGKVDITNPLFQRLRMTGRGSLISVGRIDLGPDVALPTGAGGRMMWSIVKRAFRAGEVSGNQWDDTNVGQSSFAAGFNTTASGVRAIALGDNSTASGSAAFATGNFTTASGEVSVAMGTGTVASKFATTALGNFSIASGQVATAFGNGATASGDFSLSMGETTTASGLFSVALGRLVTASNTSSIVIGSSDPTNKARLNNSIANSLMVGFNSNVSTLFVGPANGGSTLGNVGIGTSTPGAYRLNINGDTLVNGNLDVGGGGSIRQLSDIRLKTNVRVIENALGKILNLQGIKYEWKQNENIPMPYAGDEQLGFAAQEVEKVLPEIVSTTDSGYKAVSYQSLTPVLVEAMKDQQKIIDQQKAELEQLKEKQQATEHQLEQLKTLVDKLTSVAKSDK